MGSRVEERIESARQLEKQQERERREKAHREQERQAALSPRELVVEQVDHIVLRQNTSKQMAIALAKALSRAETGTSGWQVDAIYELDTARHVLTVRRSGWFMGDLNLTLYLVVTEEALVEHTSTTEVFAGWMRTVAQRVIRICRDGMLNISTVKDKREAAFELEALGVTVTDRPSGHIVTDEDVARTEEELRRFVREREQSPSPGTE